MPIKFAAKLSWLVLHTCVKPIPDREEQVHPSDAAGPLSTFSFQLHLQTNGEETLILRIP